LNPVGVTDYTWRNNPDLSCINCANPIASPSGDSAVYYVTGTNNGCSVLDSIKINIQQKQFVALQTNTYVICQGNSVTFNASGPDNYEWTPSTGLSSTTIKNPLARPGTTTIYTVTGKDSNNCFTDAANVTVTVNARPTVNIVDSVVQQMIGSSYTISSTASSDAITLDWSPKTGLSCYNCLQPVAMVNANTTYTLTATNQFGCSSSDSITIISVCKGQSFYMPNTFSPNNDGVNDYFYPRSGTAYTITSLLIFNRWGQRLFEKTNFPSNNYSYGWDGKYMNKEQAADVYIYMMELQCADGKNIIKKGNITLLR
jgi:gliding motility-associated-like protein